MAVGIVSLEVIMEDNKKDLERMNSLRKGYEGVHMTEAQLDAMKETISEAKKVKRREKQRKMIRRFSAVAAAVAVFLILPNTSPVIANAMQNIPVLGEVVRVVTFRSYVEKTDDLNISVDIPSIEMIKEDTNGLADSVNKEIYELCEQYSKEAVQRAEDYREAFLATGGTKEEWEAHNIQITVGYEVKSQTEEYLSFTVTGVENWNSGCNETRYYNIDLQQEKLISLKDLLGEDYVNIVNADIKKQMEQRTNDGETFFSPEEGGFNGISENTKFYINESGNPVIIFDKYEIAPGSAGEVEFEIER